MIISDILKELQSQRDKYRTQRSVVPKFEVYLTHGALMEITKDTTQWMPSIQDEISRKQTIAGNQVVLTPGRKGWKVVDVTVT